MKKIILSLIAIVFAINFSYAQNTFPSSGNVGIGTTSPGTALSILGSGYMDVLISGSGAIGAGLTFNSTGTGGRQYTLLSTASGAGASAGKFGIFDETSQVYRLVVDASGNVGIGTTSPAYQLDVNGNIRVPTGNNVYFDNAGGSAIRQDNGGSFNMNASATNGNGNIVLNAASGSGIYLNFSSGANTFFGNGASGTTGVINSNGSIGVGTTTVPSTYMLAVNGSAIATSMTVKLYSAWPDFVFKPAYHLPTLAEVKTYIGKNHHLPDMPSKQEVEKNGINLGEADKLLTKKVEELTLYLIEENKKNEEQQEEINQLKQRLNTLIKQLNKN